MWWRNEKGDSRLGLSSESASVGDGMEDAVGMESSRDRVGYWKGRCTGGILDGGRENGRDA